MGGRILTSESTVVASASLFRFTLHSFVYASPFAKTSM